MTAGAPPSLLPRRRALRLAHAATLAVVLAVSAGARSRVFDLPHDRADEPANLALSYSLLQSGWSRYTMRHVNRRYYPLGASGLAISEYEPGPERGDVIDFYVSGGVQHDRERSGKPPLLPALLAASWRLWGPAAGPRVLALDPRLAAEAGPRLPAYRRALLGAWLAGDPRAAAARAEQRWAAWLPLAGSLLFAAGTWLLALLAVPARAGSPAWLVPGLAGLAVACAPIEVLVAHLIQPDTVVAALGVLGSCAALLALREGPRRAGWAALAGVVLGLGALGKQTVVPLGVAYVLAEAVQAGASEDRARAWRAALPRALLFAAGALLVSGWWYLGGLRAANVVSPAADVIDQRSFSGLVIHRSWLTYPANLLVHAPLMTLGLLALPLLWPRGAAARRPPPLLLLAACAALVYGLGSLAYSDRENRYLIPLYPLLAAPCAWGLEGLRLRLGARLRSPLVAALLVYLPAAALAARGWLTGREAPLQGFLLWDAERLLFGG